jgi:ligand-binding sensor domain-containing protein
MFWLLREVVIVRVKDDGTRQVAVSKKRGFLQMLAMRRILFLRVVKSWWVGE